MVTVTSTRGLVPHTTHNTRDQDMAGHTTSQTNSVGYQMRGIREKTRMNKHAKNAETTKNTETKEQKGKVRVPDAMDPYEGMYTRNLRTTTPT